MPVVLVIMPSSFHRLRQIIDDVWLSTDIAFTWNEYLLCETSSHKRLQLVVRVVVFCLEPVILGIFIFWEAADVLSF